MSVAFKKDDISSLFLIVDKGFLTCTLFQFSSQLAAVAAAFLVLGHWQPCLSYAASTDTGFFSQFRATTNSFKHYITRFLWIDISSS